ncbi:hypothetical protein IFR04_008420 [Cadophora malorum]|uniref:Metallo-beta-lactamase domain-containing protein n=1 Tax=Cadophora malorum TaxID=108018 RepID=A0A8H7W608_9HELO|nr:hypothetical protein IFR04_008420 [Cadophora malorum]
MSVYLLNKAPVGTKIWLLHLGNLEADEGFLLSGANVSTASNPTPVSVRRAMVMISVLISHPTEGLLLYETGAGRDYAEVWGPQLSDVFARVNYTKDHELDAAIAKTGHSIKDVKGVILGHLHLDHAGGLEHFRGTDVPIYVHEEELKNAFYSVASKTDLGVYLPTYLDIQLNWKPFHGDSWEICSGLTMWLSAGHTPGLCILQINLAESGTWIFTSDQYIVKENYEASRPQGWLSRDHAKYVQSHQKVQSMQKLTDAKLVFGHCKETLMKYKSAPEYYE